MFGKAPPQLNAKELKLTEDLERLNAEGTYTLLVLVPVNKRMDIGALGGRTLPRGYYAYTGSAFGAGAQCLAGRIRRHMRKAKKKRWHIDYLLSESKVEIASVIAARTRKTMECEINQHLRNRLQAAIPIRGFGSSDCKRKCGSHLLYLGLDEGVDKRIAELYSEMVDGTINSYGKRKASST